MKSSAPRAFLIDGYNLLHAMGVLLGRVGPHGLEKARNRLLDLLADGFLETAHNITVVFDASSTNVRRDADAEQHHRGIRVLFSVGKAAADDLIEELIERCADPTHLAVVSDDHRLQRAARRGQAKPLACGEFLDLLERPRSNPPSAQGTPPPEKETPLTAEQTKRWLEEFRELSDALDGPEFSIRPEKLTPPLPPARKKP